MFKGLVGSWGFGEKGSTFCRFLGVSRFRYFGVESVAINQILLSAQSLSCQCLRTRNLTYQYYSLGVLTLLMI